MIHNERVQTAPALVSKIDGLLREAEVGKIACENFYAVGAVLPVQLV
jgi:hypothetical protein